MHGDDLSVLRARLVIDHAPVRADGGQLTGRAGVWAAAPGTAASPAEGYAPGAGSQAIDAGTDLGAAVPDDYLAVARPSGSAYDLGAFEYVASTTGGRTTTQPAAADPHPGPDGA